MLSPLEKNQGIYTCLRGGSVVSFGAWITAKMTELARNKLF